MAGNELHASQPMGLELFLDGNDRLRIRGPLRLRNVIRPVLALRRDELIAQLKRQRDEAIDWLMHDGLSRGRNGPGE